MAVKIFNVHIPFFRIFYSTTYTVILIILFVFLAISPAEIIYQCIKGASLQGIIVLGSVYVLTGALAIVIYASRLYTKRKVLADIPKPYIPIERDEVGHTVCKHIQVNLRRTNLIAWDTRPRDTRAEEEQQQHLLDQQLQNQHSSHHHHLHRIRSQHPDQLPSTALTLQEQDSKHTSTVVPPSIAKSKWGPIAHAGWSSPSSPTMPDLSFPPIIRELPHLLEAKAVSLAPTNVIAGVSVPDARIASALHRNPHTDLRGYINQLSSLDLIHPPSLAHEFIAAYENARFGADALSHERFEALLALFARVLEGMPPLSTMAIETILADLEEGTVDEFDGDEESVFGGRFGVAHPPGPQADRLTISSDDMSSSSDAGSVVRHRRGS